MKHCIGKFVLLVGIAISAWLWSGDMTSNPATGLMATAEAVIGRPVTPVSYAGVARRTTRRVVTPGLGAPGVGVTPGRGVGAPGPGARPANRGGPVNRVGRR